jgi:hypothetical protein
LELGLFYLNAEKDKVEVAFHGRRARDSRLSRGKGALHWPSNIGKCLIYDLAVFPRTELTMRAGVDANRDRDLTGG